MTFRLDPRHALASQVRRLLRHECTAALQALNNATGDPVHAVRRHGKRSRALLRLVRPGMTKKAFRRINHAWRAIGRRLSPARDRTVLRQSLVALARRYPEHLGATTVARVRSLLQRDRRHLPTAADLEMVRRALTDLIPLVRALSLESGWSAAVAGHVRSHAACIDAGRAAAGRTAATPRHEWRKRAKDVRYQIHLLAHLIPGTKRIEAGWDGLGELLGQENDLVMLRRWLAKAARETEAQPLLRQSAAWLRHLRQRSDETAKRLPDDPGAMGKLLRCARKHGE